MKRNAVIAILAVFLILPCFGSIAKTNLKLDRPNKPAEADFEEERTPEDAINALLYQLEEDPYNSELYECLAYCFDYVGDYENLLKATELQVAYLPDDCEEKDVVYGNLARTYMLNDRMVEGKMWLDRADEVNSDNFYNRWLSVHYNILKQNYKEAACELKKVSELQNNKDEMDVYYQIYLWACEAVPDENNVIKIFQEVIKLEPDNARGYRVLAGAIRNADLSNIEKNLGLIMKYYKKSLELDPDYILTYVSIANLYMYLYAKSKDEVQYGKALEWFKKGYEVSPGNVRLAYAEGMFYFLTYNNDKAIERLEFAYEKGLQDSRVTDGLSKAYNTKAYNYYKSGENIEEGLKLIELAIALSPDNGIIISTKAELLYKTGRYEEAYQCVKKAIELEPDEKEIQKDLAMIEEALNKKRGK
ncbi:tetratricopeptide repeat protein [bacterium]|nr:tetratricopeptide repeat protein [bacterium]